MSPQDLIGFSPVRGMVARRLRPPIGVHPEFV
jgi:hypothetical protein